MRLLSCLTPFSSIWIKFSLRAKHWLEQLCGDRSSLSLRVVGNPHIISVLSLPIQCAMQQRWRSVENKINSLYLLKRTYIPCVSYDPSLIRRLFPVSWKLAELISRTGILFSPRVSDMRYTNYTNEYIERVTCRYWWLEPYNFLPNYWWLPSRNLVRNLLISTSRLS